MESWDQDRHRTSTRRLRRQLSHQTLAHILHILSIHLNQEKKEKMTETKRHNRYRATHSGRCISNGTCHRSKVVHEYIQTVGVNEVSPKNCPWSSESYCDWRCNQKGSQRDIGIGPGDRPEDESLVSRNANLGRIREDSTLAQSRQEDDSEAW
jgi:hypothetical protein